MAATTPLPRDARGRLLPRAVTHEPTPNAEPEMLDPLDSTEAAALDPLETREPETANPYDTAEAEQDELPDAADRQQALAQRAGLARVESLLKEALRLGQQYGLVLQRPDGSVAIPSMIPVGTRDSSECTCPSCGPHHQQHWWCMTCQSGPHDWLMVKPQYERQTLKPGGIEGIRHACCSAQCARDYLAHLGRQPSGVRESRQIDPTLALPGVA